MVTKTTCIINGPLAPDFKASLLETMENEPYSLAVTQWQWLKWQWTSKNKSTHCPNIWCTKGMCNNSAIWYVSLLQVGMEVQQLLSLKRLMKKWPKMKSPGLTVLDFVLTIQVQTLGSTIPLKQECWKTNPEVYFMACTCHVFHNTARSACARFIVVTGFDVDDFCVDRYYFFENSSKRKGVLSEFCEFFEVEYKSTGKCWSTWMLGRWLSLERAVGRILSQYEYLKSYFLSKSDSSPMFKRLEKAFTDPITEVNLMFFHAVMPMFTTPN